MGTQLWTWTVWLFILYGTTSTVTVAAKCQQECPSTSTSVFQYQDGHKYTYNLEGTSVTTLPGTEGDVSKLQLKATVELSVQSACSHVVKLKDVRITGAGGKKYGSLKNLEAHSAIANFQGGIINSQLCTEEDEPRDSLNIKRAVLSLLQVSASAGSGNSIVREVDVFGICPTEITSSREGDVVTVKKVRNLNRCAHREDLRQEILSTPFVGNADLHSTPLLESTYSSEQQIKKGIISSAVSHESYLFRPFSRLGSGARTTVETKLTLASETAQADSAPASASTPRSIIFEAPHVKASSATTSNKQAIVDALLAAGESMKVSVGTDSASKFRKLVEVLRDSSKEDILTVYGQVKAGAGFSNKHAARKVLLDGIFRAGTGDSVVAAVELLKSNEISGDQTKLWYMSIGYVQHTSIASLEAVSALLDDAGNVPREGILAIGSLAGRYCRDHNCENVPQLNDLLGKLAKMIKLKVKSIKEENNAIVALKALANIHHLNDAVAEKVKQVASDKTLPARLRVAALETYQSDACHSAFKKSALDILSDHLEDSEVRIKAYLAVVECPSGAVANSLKKLLENEPTNQVGSYIVSHLRNLRASTNPSKEQAKQHFRNLKSRKHYPSDFRKFSHNYELSYILDGLNVGNSLEANVIYSQNSYIPRSVGLNLTTEIFGHSYNVLELSTRTENADKILESYLGPNGYLKKHSWLEIIEALHSTIKTYGNKIKEKLENTFRLKRSISQNDLDRIKNEVIKSLPPSHEGNELILDLSLKLFGSEISWISMNKDAIELSAEGILDRIFDTMNKAIDKAKNFKHEIRNHCVFLDTELTYPTGLGFPLKLDASGSTAVHLMVSGQLDISGLLNNAPNSEISLDLRPSAAIEVIGTMMVSTPVEDSGLKVAYTLHTDTGISISVKDLERTGVDINVGLPVKKQDLLTIKTDILSVVHEHGHQEVDTPVTFNINRKEYSGCFDQASPLIGLTLCADIGFPYDLQSRSSALYPLNGPSILSLRLEGEDVSSYHFRTLVNDKDPKHKSVEILFETPKTQVDRKLELLLSYDAEPHREIKANFKSPWKTLTLQGILVDTNDEHSLTARFLDDASEYSLKIGAKVSGDSSHQTYTPILEYKLPDQKGRLATKGTKTSGRMVHKYNVQGTVIVDKQADSRKLTFNKVTLKTPQGDIGIDGTISRNVNSFSSDLKVTYGSQHVILKSNLQKVGDHHYKINAGVVPSKEKDLGLGITWEIEYNPNDLRNDLIIIHGGDLKSETNRITINQQVHFQVENLKNFDISTKNSLTYPLLNVNMRFDGNAKPKNINYDLHIGYDTYVIASELHAKRDIKKPGDYDVAFLLKILNSILRLNSNRDIVGPDRSKFVHLLELSPIAKYELSTDVTHKYQRNNVNLQLLAVLKIDDKPTQYELDSGLIMKPDLVNTHAKLNVGSDTVVDCLMVLNTEANKPNGNVKVFVKEYIDGTSKFSFSKRGGVASLEVLLPKINRKINGAAEVTVSGTVHVGNVDFYWNFDQDKNQKISIQTTSDIKADAIDSKNTIYIMDYKTVLNIKGALTGKVNDGHLIANGDLILPNGRQFTVKYDETLHVRPTNSEGRVEIVLIDIPKKGSQPRRLSLEGAAKVVDPKQVSFEGSGKLEYKCPEGKDIKLTVHAKNIPQGEQNIIGGEAHIEGSYIPHAINVKVDAEVSKAVITYKGSGSYGSDSSLNVAGNIRTGLGGTSPKQIDNTIEIKLPTEELKHLKLTTSGSLSSPSETQCELKTNNVLTWNDANTVKLDGEIRGSSEEGAAKVIVTLPKEKARSLGVTWSNPEDTGSGLKKGGSLNLHWDDDKEINVAGEIEIPQDQKSYKLKVIATTPSEKLKKLDLVLTSKKIESPARHIETDAVLLLNEKTITLHSKIGLAPGVPIIDVTLDHPMGVSKLYLNVDKFTERELKMQTKVQWAAYGGGTLASEGEIKLDVDDFKFLWTIDSPELKIKKWRAEAGHRAVKGTKKIIFSVSDETDTLLSGSSTLRSKSDGNLITYDGSGVVEISGQNQRFNFRIERVQLTKDTNGETGIQYKGNVKVGPKEVDGLLKISNKEFHYLNKYCLKGEDCAVVELKSKLNFADITELNQETVFLIDLKSLNTPYGIDLRSNTIRQGINIDHGFDLKIFTKEHQTRYNYKVMINEKSGSVTITLPQRVIALEVTSDVDGEPKQGRAKVGFTLWWDKVRKPSSKSVGSVLLTHNIDSNGILLSGEARFNNPSLERELVVSGRTLLKEEGLILDSSLDLDVFKKENQKITVLVQGNVENIQNGLKYLQKLEIKSKGQNIDIVLQEEGEISVSRLMYIASLNYRISKQPKKEAILKLEGTLKNLNFLVKIPSAEILRIEGSVKKENDLPVVDAEISAIGLETLVIHSALEKKGLFTFTSNVHKKNAPNNKVVLSGSIDDIVGVRAERVKGGDRQDLFHVSISTKNEDFLKTDFGWSTENIRKLTEEVRQDISKMLQKVKKFVTDFVTQLKDELISLLDTLRKNQPNIKRLMEVGQQQMKLIRNEIENDAVLHEISENLQKIFGEVAAILEETIKEVSNVLQSVYSAILSFEHAVIEAVKNASPAISEAWKNVVESVIGLVEIALQELSEIISEIAKFVQLYEAEVKQYLLLFTEFLQDIGKVVSGALHKIVDELRDFSKIVVDEVKSLNIYSEAKKRYAEFIDDLENLDLASKIWGPLREILAYIKEGLPTVEVQDFVSHLEEYIDKVIKHQPVDYKSEVKTIYQKLVRAIKSVITMLRGYMQEPDVDVGLPGYKVPLSISSVLDLPRLVAVRFSPLSYLISEELPDLQELYYTYKPTLDPLDWIPPYKAYGILVDSNNFFTFDHRHYKLKGSCSYVLAQDYHDGNFSIVANLEGGQLQSIAITDGTDSIELLADRSLKVNGAPHEYPVRLGQLRAWRQYSSAHIKSTSGVHIHCHTDSDLCFIEVSGFYFARTRGLLGTINYEPWDDFMTPNGHVATKTSEFANAWKLNAGCPDVPEEATTGDTSVTECTDIFSGSSDVRNCFPFVNPSGFREACNEAARNAGDAGEKKKIACAFAASYVEICKHHTPVINIPSSCAYCSAIGGKKFGVGETESLKVPQRSADIVVLVEQVTDNAEVFKELITPLVPTLTNDLKFKGITDVKFFLIGYGAPGQKWPNHYTSGGDLGFGGKDITFSPVDPEVNITIDSTKSALQWLKQRWNVAVREISQVEAFVEATKFPFRVGTVKAIVSVIATPCEKTNALSPVALAFSARLYNELGINTHLITPVENIYAEGKEEKQIKQLVGFDDEATFSLNDAKKKVLEGDHELRKNLDYTSTVCTEGAQKIHGAVFNSNNFVNAKQPARKQFIQVVSHRIADSLASVELTEDCTCLLLHGVHPTPVCRVKNRREKEHTKVKGVKG
ncbi:apolipophorins [Anabrus simplex]|uniref:apolipophorins n=1 Tax=Anabrus simplex TaxID=316456 RepID=UPI0035A330FA